MSVLGDDRATPVETIDQLESNGLNPLGALARAPGWPYYDRMNATALHRATVPLAIVRWLIGLGILAALVFALSADVQQFDVSRE